jgi:hypothetical protein
MENMAAEDRLTRIENKLDQLTDAMVAMARMEERMVTLFKRMDRYDEAHVKLENKLSTLEKTSIRRSVVEAVFDKGFWLIGGGLLTWFLRK